MTKRREWTGFDGGDGSIMDEKAEGINIYDGNTKDLIFIYTGTVRRYRNFKACILPANWRT